MEGPDRYPAAAYEAVTVVIGQGCSGPCGELGDQHIKVHIPDLLRVGIVDPLYILTREGARQTDHNLLDSGTSVELQALHLF